MTNVNPVTAFNTAASFVTNTNWQNYSGESTMGYVTQMAGLAVQNFVSAARRHRGRHRADPRVHADEDRPARQLLGRPDPGDAPAAAADLGRRRDHLDGDRRDRRTSAPLTVIHTLARGAARPWSAARWPRRRSSRSWAPTAAASSTPTPRTRSRTRTRSATGSRSSCCWSSRSRCRGRSARWSATTGRATSLVAVMAGAVAGCRRRHHLLRVAARGHRAAGRARRDGGQGGPLRHPGRRRCSPGPPRVTSTGAVNSFARLVHRRSAAASRCST